jgi:hypothetical protein
VLAALLARARRCCGWDYVCHRISKPWWLERTSKRSQVHPAAKFSPQRKAFGRWRAGVAFVGCKSCTKKVSKKVVSCRCVWWVCPPLCQLMANSASKQGCTVARGYHQESLGAINTAWLLTTRHVLPNGTRGQQQGLAASK